MTRMTRHTQLHDTLRCLRAVAVVLVLCFTAQSCHQDTDLTPDLPTQDGEIQFQTSGVGTTRGLIESLAVGSEICLYGYHDGAYLAAGNDDKKLAGKTLKYLSADRWSVVNDEGNPITYFWEGNGDYRFFGWLAKDATDPTKPLSVPAEWTYEESTKSLKIPATILDKDYNQFDFLYSNVHERTLPTQSKSDPVALEMSHLFTAFGIGISNTSKDDVTIKSLTLRTLHDKGSAVIDYSTTPCKVNYGETSISRNPNTDPYYTLTDDTGDYTIQKQNGVLYNIFDPSATAKKYYLMWPQAESVFPELKFANDEEEADADDTLFPIILEYESNGQTFKKRLKFPKQAWEAGKLNYFDILIADKLVEIKATVKDWNYSHADVDYSASTVTVKQGNHLIWDESTCRVVADAKKVYVKNGQPVEGTFTIDTPEGGQWRVSLEGDVNAFKILDDTAPTDDGFGPIDAKQHRIRIVPLISSPDRDYSVMLKFVAITADSKTYPADDMVQDYDNNKQADRYTIVLEDVN